MSKPVNHPQYVNTIGLGEQIIVCFEVGYYAKPPKEAVEADARIREVIESLAKELAIVGEWHGNLCYYSMVSKPVNPEITDEMREEFKAAAAAAYPEMRVIGGWDNANGGLMGFSVKMTKKKEG
jgi:hypothetical protein